MQITSMCLFHNLDHGPNFPVLRGVCECKTSRDRYERQIITFNAKAMNAQPLLLFCLRWKMPLVNLFVAKLTPPGMLA